VNPNDPNVVLIEVVSQQLGEALREQLVFVGGAVVGLLITDPAMPAIRPTDDVDLVAQVAALREYHAIERALEARGFRHDLRKEAPVCRWLTGEVALDVMPTDESVLGFSNRWYRLAMQTAHVVALPSGVNVRLIRAPEFIATKLEAFSDRGRGDYLASHDLGDLLAVIDGRATLLEECRACDVTLRNYLCDRFARLLATPPFKEALAGHLPGDAASQERLPDLELKLRALAGLK
jgi:predicted nucleotidyltransferase